MTFLLRCSALLLCTCLPVLSVQASDQPITPPAGEVMLERAAAARDPAAQRLRELRAALTAAPADLERAHAYAEAAIALGRSRSDPRYFGYARAALAPWIEQPEPPLSVRLLRASLAQREHRFEAARADLEAVLATQPGNAQAHIGKAVIHFIEGQPREAVPHCAQLAQLGVPLVAITCAANVASLGGRSQEALSGLLQGISVSGRGAPTDQQIWALLNAAEIAARLDDTASARSLFEAAIRLEGTDPALRSESLRAAYADFLIAHNDFAAARQFLAGETAVDALLLRLVLAERRLPEAQADYAAHRQLFAQRLALQRARGESLHQRDETRFLLEVQDDPVAALPVAVSNWTQQREPADARLLLAAAAGAGQQKAAEPVLAWMRDTGINDPALKRLADAVSAATGAPR